MGQRVVLGMSWRAAPSCPLDCIFSPLWRGLEAWCLRHGTYLCKKTSGHTKDECNSLICFISDAFNFCSARLWVDTTLVKVWAAGSCVLRGTAALSWGILFVLSEQNYKDSNNPPFSGKLSFILLPIRYSGLLAQGCYGNIVSAGLQTSSQCSQATKREPSSKPCTMNAGTECSSENWPNSMLQS